MRHAFAVIVVLVVAAGSAAATPALLRPGANHHLGDDSFVARFGREPTAADSEAVRMNVHLTYVHDRLASHTATRPELQQRRTQLLGYLDDYIAKGTTPKNTYVPYRNPVFIDRDGTICAVGYLLEKSVNREVAEHVAATHRLDYLEDIAAALPEVAAWIESSGFTVDELASIQPGYPGPEVMHMGGWLADKAKDDDGWQDPIGAPIPGDGPYAVESGAVKTAGAFAGHRMTGEWKVTIDGKLRGHGTFSRGRGDWTSLRADGTELGEGRFANNRPSGTWTFYHPSGRIAAKGTMHGGRRDGQWTFFYDSAGSPTLSAGKFGDGETHGTWHHYAQTGALVATTGGRPWAGLSLDIEPGATGVRHVIHQGIPADNWRLDGLLRGDERIYIDDQGKVYDGTAHALEQDSSGAWSSRHCTWSKRTRAAASTGDVTALHQALMKIRDDDGCDAKAVTLTKKRTKRINAILATRAMSHAPIPSFDIDPRPVVPEAASEGETELEASDAEAPTPRTGPRDNPADLATYLTDTMTWYIEWPHVDESFVSVYATLPGYQPAPPDSE